ncbi:hypothetical protein P154DRAFT_140188 [Amniculicola lignicola CBS 123094]|uniref:Myb-like domain-containing protein n=1 Tax=Amniculicola lignicola CBS 123094 TaxID=1392246 RepID=A0A6A5WP25_9PLEO|nr:hypothetical protein P154DRAFT_140188 [Amniculicola lignicola CBS 123094]
MPGSSGPPLAPNTMQGGPVLPAISELHRHPDPPPQHQFRPLYTGPSISSVPHPGPPGPNGSPPTHMLKRAASQTPLPEESPAKKQSKWTPEEDNLTIELRGQGMKWDDIARRLPGRSSISCRLRYQNYLEKRAVWDEEKKNKLARLYARFKDQMWQKVASEMGIPWRSAESMHWQLGEQEMSSRANAPVFTMHPSANPIGSPSATPATPAAHGFTPTNAAQLVPNLPVSQSQHHQPGPPLPPPPAPIQAYHQRNDSNSSQDRRRASSFSRRRADGRSRSSVPPQIGAPLPPLKPALDVDSMSGARLALAAETQPGMRRDGESVGFVGPYLRRRQDEESVSGYKLDPERRSQGERSPDRSSQRSATGSVKSTPREREETEIAVPKEPPVPKVSTP